ncbi:hypothetical protein ABZV80_34535 [Streptomyces sp. NPDC005132]|uniref:hypothetical protein n=1 Tax=Streptomyces sp. NPDC005132 TaxID=3154294 RepID=UPI0033B9E6BA
MSPTARGSPTRHSAHRTNATATATAPSIPRDLVVDVAGAGTHSAGLPDGRARTALAAKQREKTADAAGLNGPRSAADVRAAREPADIVGVAAPALKPGRSESGPRGVPANAPPSVGTSGVGAHWSPVRRRHRTGVPRSGVNEVRRVR